MSIAAQTDWSDQNVNLFVNRTFMDQLVSTIATVDPRERRVLVIRRQEYADANPVGKEDIARRLAK